MDEIDDTRRPSLGIVEAYATRHELHRALDAVAGIFRGTPHAMTREEVTAWIAELRSEETA